MAGVPNDMCVSALREARDHLVDLTRRVEAEYQTRSHDYDDMTEAYYQGIDELRALIAKARLLAVRYC